MFVIEDGTVVVCRVVTGGKTVVSEVAGGS